MANPLGTFHNAETGETEIRELTNEELAYYAEHDTVEIDETPSLS